MTYRIKIITYANGRKEYVPQVKIAIFKFFKHWGYLDYEGKLIECECKTNQRDLALRSIDWHNSGNNVVKTIEFEYINK